MRPPTPEEHVESAAASMRMAELASRSGVSRETIHFYLREGLLPKPRKGGRTVAYYDESHLARLQTIRRLREEKYLPLSVIKRVIDSGTAGERDIDFVADALQMDSQAAAPATDDRLVAPSARAVRVATEHRLIPGSHLVDEAPLDDGERRVLQVIDELLGLPKDAQPLTLKDLELCASAMQELVIGETRVFFDAAVGSGDFGQSLAALKVGRGVVARFLRAHRDLMLTRVVEGLIEGIQAAAQRLRHPKPHTLPASTRSAFGVTKEAQRLIDTSPDAAAVVLVAWGELEALSRMGAPLSHGERARALVTWAKYSLEPSEAGFKTLEPQLAASTSPLSMALLAETKLLRAVLGEGPAGDTRGILDEAIPSLHALFNISTVACEPVEATMVEFIQARATWHLPPVLGRRPLAQRTFERIRERAVATGDRIFAERIGHDIAELSKG